MTKYNALNLNPFSVHQKIVHLVGRKKKVLDVGCSVGVLAKEMSNNNCKVVGIELDEKSIKKAQKYCVEIICGDVESIELKSQYDNYFDFIIFADVLEHLVEPSKVLKRFTKYLKKDGYVIISLPNVANWKIRFKLLFGNFDYEDHGLLDESHIRFFTEKNAKKLIYDAGLEISEFDVTVGDVNKFASILHSIGFLWPNLMAYQFLIMAKKIN